MKKLIFILSVALFYSCESKEFKYKIEGEVTSLTRTNQWPEEPRYDTVVRKAYWYTDTFKVVNDTVIIQNSNGTQFRIAPPYTIKVKGSVDGIFTSKTQRLSVFSYSDSLRK